jgi:hypothetical protein
MITSHATMQPKDEEKTQKSEALPGIEPGLQELSNDQNLE